MEKEKNQNITLNGVVFTPEMIKTMQEWYSNQMPNESGPDIMIGCLKIASDCLIELSQENLEKDKEIMRALRQIKFVEEELKPFLEGGAV